MIAALVLIVLAGAAGVWYVIHANPVPVKAGPPPELARLGVLPAPETAPGVGFADADGKRVTLASFRGHAMLVNLWATWCAPCVRELPELAHLKSALPGLDVVAINVGRDNAAETAQFLRAHGADGLSVYVDRDAALIRAFAIQGLPFSVLLDADGREIARALGPCEWSAPSAIAYLRKLAAPRAAS